MKKLSTLTSIAILLLILWNQSKAQNLCVDNFEVNDSKQRAAQILTNEVYQAMIANTLDVDWFKFDMTADKPNLTVTLFNLPKNYNLFVYDENGNKVGASKHNGSVSEAVVANNLPAGTYYAKVRGRAGVFDAFNCYSFKAEANAAPYKQTDISEDLVNNNSQFEFYPNPATDKLFIQCDDEQISSVTFSIFNFLGQRVSETMSQNSSATIDVSSLKAGEYLLEIRYDGGKEVRKFVVSK